ncbi:MAG: hypothetical protein QM496_20775 [Verrucomicrobiota bacterium]
MPRFEEWMRGVECGTQWHCVGFAGEREGRSWRITRIANPCHDLKGVRSAYVWCYE